MFFHVIPFQRKFVPPALHFHQAFLVSDNWDDFGSFSTWFDLWYVDDVGETRKIGGLKIGQFGMGNGHSPLESGNENRRRSPIIPNEFDQLDNSFFSVGQGEIYYENLKSLGEDLRVKILVSLRDMAYDKDIFDHSRKESVAKLSLFRSVTPETVEGQFRRLTKGKHRHVGYKFSYFAPGLKKNASFEISPGQLPPTNIQVFIGSNGSGKSTILHKMSSSAVQALEGDGKFEFNKIGDDGVNQFANVISVSFSAFDKFKPISEDLNSSRIRYKYIGLKRIEEILDENRSKINIQNDLTPKSPEELAREFANSLIICGQLCQDRWITCMSPILEQFFVDTAVQELHIWDKRHYYEADEATIEETCKIFDELSSGHKIVLLTLTSLIEKVAESTLVLIDEPETHLHPPFLAAYMKTLSELLIERNAVAIVATHSPVVLQEVPKKCVWRIMRSGDEKTVARPNIETYGENVGTITNDVFHLEVSKSGFHKVMSESADRFKDYDLILNAFKNQVGAEARALLRTLLASKVDDTNRKEQ